MTTTIDALFDGKVLLPDTPIPLEPNTRVRITIQTPENDVPTPHSFLKTARSLSLETPPDFSARLDDFLYGENKDG